MSIFKVQQTKIGKIDRLLKLASQNKFYFAFGKDTPWDNTYGENVTELNPPAPSEDDDQIIEPFILIKAFRVAPVTEKQCESIPQLVDDIKIGTRVFRILDKTALPEDITVINPSYLFIEGSLENASFESYRSVGLYLNPIIKEGVSLTKLSYLPSELDSFGVLYNLTHCAPVYSITDISKVQFIITI